MMMTISKKTLNNKINKNADAMIIKKRKKGN